ncbi:MAG: hypothetical protein AB1646_25400 [Thermodesulfobacteriota bacterium]
MLIRLKDGTTIEGYAKWNDEWAEIRAEEPHEKLKKFPEIIFQSGPDITVIGVHTHLRSIKYPVRNLLVATRECLPVLVREVEEIKLNPGPHDDYAGAGSIPVVSPRVADLLQTKPLASCHFDAGISDDYWLSYDPDFSTARLKQLCENKEQGSEGVQDLSGRRNVIHLSFPFD